MRRGIGLFRDQRGASAVEFALLAPVFLTFLFGIIEIGRLAWTQQVIQQAAYRAARCNALSATGCTNIGDTQAYVVAQAAAGGVTLTTAAVTAATGATCNGVSGQSSVAINLAFQSVLPVRLSMFNRMISTTACFPTQPPEA